MSTKIAVFASGEGSNFEALVKATREGRLDAQIVGLITNKPKIPALARAERLHVPYATFSRKSFAAFADWDRAIVEQLRRWNVEFVALAGFLALIGPEMLRAFPRKIVNSHPSLLPKYGGAGLYGGRVHEAVLAAGEKETGITIHLIDEEYDHGETLAQTRVPVLKGDTVSTLSARVKEIENSFYPETLNRLLLNGISTR